MRSITCRLEFADGRLVTAQALSPSPADEAPVRYSGPVERLGAARCDKGRLGFVEWYLRGRARHVKARFEVVAKGEYARETLFSRKPVEPPPRARRRFPPGRDRAAGANGKLCELARSARARPDRNCYYPIRTARRRARG